ncbi:MULTISPECIES: hypothetical protein [Amycolatopsis]|uniref:hypothetical protein n=1 Tax=Amycolatopsis TaxID=1813 RepID=UPI00174C4F1F|nr:hypothetical protein [Amycolatopsis bullii]
MIRESRDIPSGLDVNVPSVRTTVRRMSGGQRQSPPARLRPAVEDGAAGSPERRQAPLFWRAPLDAD